ncbi:MAG: o-succinylbenzoate synthase [Ilumatobacteraceae bacterium]|nr:o-succinylbenzoate synthase [Ilumatobacteraceae bacterium]
MRLESVELIRVKMPLVRPFRTSFGEQTVRDVLLVNAYTGDGHGWGECVAQVDPFYSEEFIDGAQMVLETWLIPQVLAQQSVVAEDVPELLKNIKGHRSAKAALEMAILDAQLRARGHSLSRYLGGVRDTVEVGVSVGITNSVDELLDVVAGYVADGYTRVKLKIEPGWDVEPVRAVRARFNDLRLQVDANTAYRVGDIEHLKKLDEFGLLLIEQPFEEDDLATHALFAQQISTAVCLDESIVSTRSTEVAIDAGACSIVNIKVGRVGGLIESRKIHDLCVSRGVDVWCGGMLESGVGRAANVALASMSGFTLPGDISASNRYFAQDITEPFELVGSCLKVPTGPGLGVTVDQEMLASLGAVRTHITGR